MVPSIEEITAKIKKLDEQLDESIHVSTKLMHAKEKVNFIHAVVKDAEKDVGTYSIRKRELFKEIRSEVYFISEYIDHYQLKYDREVYSDKRLGKKLNKKLEDLVKWENKLLSLI